ncbi:MAG TPA: hydantoinase B/oxoprolinase family protein [Solirubrobacterales bacterium]|nr:hydantoinase B/oxoprolinase family protein [Solirubrobacterales bacterium]
MSETTVTEPNLRDLGEEQFARRYGAGRFTCGVLANRGRYIAEHICTDLLHRAFSPIITFSQDFVGAIVGPPDDGYPLAAVNKGNVIFLGSLSTGVRNTVWEYGLERLEPGDLLICNDPFRVGNHVNDMCFIRPVFHDGEIVSFVVIRAHQLDIGGIVPGGFSLMKKNVYENGLVLGPQLIFHRDEPVKELMRTILDNTRFGETLLPDFHTIRSCCALGERLIQESIERYGIDAYKGAIRYNTDASAASMRAAIASLPDGDWEGEDAVDSDGVDAESDYRVHVALRKRGERLEVDLSGSSEQSRTSLNATALDAQTAVALAVKLVLDPFSPFTSGIYRDIDVLVPPASVIGAGPPAAVMFYFEVQSVLINAILRALAGPLGSRAVAGAYGSTNLHTGEGVTPDGTPWFSAAELEAQYGAWGATDAGDGNNHSGLATLNMIMPSVEEIEPRVPAMILHREYLADTAGPGTHRGGSALMKQSIFLADGDHYLVPLHFRSPSGSGVHDGEDGRAGGSWFFEDQTSDSSTPVGGFRVPDPDDFSGAAVVAGTVDPESGRLDPAGEFAFFGRHQVWGERRGSVLRWITNGGGGWGDPLARDPEAVLRDVRDEYVSIAGARDDYGVIVAGDPATDPEGLELDLAATEARREELRAARAGGNERSRG